MPMTLLRTALIYALLLLAMRMLGKRQLGELELSELVVTVLVADIAVRPIVEENAPFFPSLAPLLVLFGSEYLISVMSLRSAKLRTLFFGKPSILISHGKIDQNRCLSPHTAAGKVFPLVFQQSQAAKCSVYDFRDQRAVFF